MLKAILKDGMIEQVENQTPKLRPLQDLSRTWWQFEDNFETMLEMSAHAHFSKCSPKNNLSLSLIATQMDGWKFELEVEGNEPT